MNDKIKQTLNQIIEHFKNGDIPEAVSLACYPIPNTPSIKWSFLNRTLMFLAGTGDGRGFRQWQEVNRWVKSGAKAFYILVPCFRKEIDDDGEEKTVLYYFRCAPVFKYEDTDGEPIDHHKIEVPDLPLIKRAFEWGISVKAIPGEYKCYGYYSHDRKEIILASPEEKVFFHELAHASHARILGGLKTKQDPIQEIVAELAAQSLYRIVGKREADTTGNSFKYIEAYAANLKMSAHTACLFVLNETEKVLTNILKGDDHESVGKVPGTSDDAA